MPRVSLHPPLVLLPLAVGAVIFCSGCNRNDETILTYRAPKQAETPAETARNAAGLATVHWTAPADWEEQPPSGFRKGSFVVRGPDGKTADVSVISFPETAGGLLANVNRWRDQLKLAPITNEAEAGTPLSASGRDIFFVDLVSAQPIGPEGSKTRILGGIFPLPGETWFFKMMGPDDLVAAQRESFQGFLQSVHAAESGPASAPVPAAPMNTNAGGSTNAPPPPLLETLEGTPLHYTLPANWQEKPLTPMRLASFTAAAPNGKKVDVSVVSLGGAAGGDLANVNRWRDQLKLPPIDQAALQQAAEHLQVDGRDFLIFDLASADAIGDPPEKARIIAAMVDEGERSWFIKMTGEDAAVASQKNAFTDFLRSLKFH
ncbi:MAG: hypothetical protein ABI992_09480 [Chthoniobacterales bacterium]